MTRHIRCTRLAQLLQDWSELPEARAGRRGQTGLPIPLVAASVTKNFLHLHRNNTQEGSPPGKNCEEWQDGKSTG